MRLENVWFRYARRSRWVLQGVDLTVLPVEADGRLDMDVLGRELDQRVLLVAVMQVNNEIGVTQRISEIAEMAHDAGALMLCDAVQAFGRIDLCQGPDLVAMSAHKIHGPKGIGALWMKKGKEPAGLIHGGGLVEGGERKVGFFARLVDDGALIGWINLSEIVRGGFQNAYIGYHGYAGHSGQGYMTEALQLVLREAFVTHKLHRVEANI